MTMNSFFIYTTKIERLRNAFKTRYSTYANQQCESVSKTRKKRITLFNSLPDEIIIRIISELISDLDTVHNIMMISKRMSDLSLHVLASHMLPVYSIEAIIDQEGRNRTFTQFKFEGVNTETHSVCFIAISPPIRRYYTNKEAPTIRQAMLKDNNSTSNLNDGLERKATGEQDQILLDKMSEKEINQLDQAKTFPSIAATTVSKVLLETRNQKIHKVKQEGIYSLQSPRSFTSLLYSSSYTNIQNRFMWKLGYQIDRKLRKEYYLTPLYLDIHVSYFIKLIQRKKTKGP